MEFLGGSASIEAACNTGDTGNVGSIPGSRRSPGEGNGNPPQYCCLENPWTEGLGGYSPWGHKKVGHNLKTKQQQ